MKENHRSKKLYSFIALEGTSGNRIWPNLMDCWDRLESVVQKDIYPLPEPIHGIPCEPGLNYVWPRAHLHFFQMKKSRFHTIDLGTQAESFRAITQRINRPHGVHNE